MLIKLGGLLFMDRVYIDDAASQWVICMYMIWDGPHLVSSSNNVGKWSPTNLSTKMTWLWQSTSSFAETGNGQISPTGHNYTLGWNPHPHLSESLNRSLLIVRSGTDLIALLILFFFFFLLGRPLQIKPKRLRPFRSDWDGIWQECSSCKYAVTITESDFRIDVILSRWRPLYHFTQKSAAIWCTQCLACTHVAASASSWSIVPGT